MGGLKPRCQSYRGRRGRDAEGVEIDEGVWQVCIPRRRFFLNFMLHFGTFLCVFEQNLNL